MTPVTGTIRYTNVLSAGSIRLDTARELVVDGSVRSSLGALSLYGENEYGVLVNIKNSGSLSAANDLTVSAIDEAQIIGNNVAYSSDGGNITLGAGRELNLRSASMSTPRNINLLASNDRSVSAKVDVQGTISSGGILDLRAQNEGYVIASGSFTSGGDVKFTAGRSVSLTGAARSMSSSIYITGLNSNPAINTAVVVDANLTADQFAYFAASGPQPTISINPSGRRWISDRTTRLLAQQFRSSVVLSPVIMPALNISSDTVRAPAGLPAMRSASTASASGSTQSTDTPGSLAPVIAAPSASGASANSLEDEAQ
jgi:hypothetical protein